MRERQQRAFEVGERQPFVHRQQLDLAEGRGVGDVEVVAAEDAPGRDDPDRRLVGLHVPDLHPRGVRPQQRAEVVLSAGAAQRARQVQGVLHVAGRVRRRHVQRVKAVPLVFRLRPLDDRKAHASENVVETIAHDGQRVAMAQARRPSRQRHGDGAGGGGVAGLFRIRRPPRVDGLLQLVGVASDAFLFVGGRGADELHPGCDHAVLASEVAVADGLRVARRLRLSEFGVESRHECGHGFRAWSKVGHGWN